jgi:hypothetical protein
MHTRPFSPLPQLTLIISFSHFFYFPPRSSPPDTRFVSVFNPTQKKKKSWIERIKVILRASKQHATNLAKFVAIYKSLLLLQRKLNGGKGRPHDSFFAGLLGGYFVFGERNAINEQVRTVLMLPPPSPCGYAAAVCIQYTHGCFWSCAQISHHD